MKTGKVLFILTVILFTFSLLMGTAVPTRATTITVGALVDGFIADVPPVDGVFDIVDSGSDTLKVEGGVNFFDQTRAALEFDISFIVDSSTVSSATLSLFNSVAVGPDFPNIFTEFHGYKGNGSIEIDDANVDNLLTTENPTTGFLTVDVTSFIWDLVDVNHDFAGFMLRTPAEGSGKYTQFMFPSSEFFDPARRPQLIITPIPEPSTYMLLLFGLTGMIGLKKKFD